MTLFASPQPLGDDFCGQVRLFPLPNLVIFPGVVQPLHVFEPRYREMVADAMSGDRLIALASLAPGWEADYEGRPSIHPAVCIGRILTHAPLEDGCSNLLLLGVQRAVVTVEHQPAAAFRRADVRVLGDQYSPGGDAGRAELRGRLIEVFRPFAPRSEESKAQLEKLFSPQMPLGMLTDIFAHALPLELEFKQKLLAECDVDRRANALLEASAAWRPSARVPYPPGFSEN